jgi:hypothetical protein
LLKQDGTEPPPFRYNADGSALNEGPLTQKHLIPQKYEDRTKPLFDVSVEKGKVNKFTFDLTAK